MCANYQADPTLIVLRQVRGGTLNVNQLIGHKNMNACEVYQKMTAQNEYLSSTNLDPRVQVLEKSFIFLARHRNEREGAGVCAAMLCSTQGCQAIVGCVVLTCHMPEIA